MIKVHLPTLDPEELAQALYRARYGVSDAHVSAWGWEATLVQDKWRDAAEAVLALFKAAEAAEHERCAYDYEDFGRCGIARNIHPRENYHAFVAPKPEPERCVPIKLLQDDDFARAVWVRTGHQDDLPVDALMAELAARGFVAPKPEARESEGEPQEPHCCGGIDMGPEARICPDCPYAPPERMADRAYEVIRENWDRRNDYATNCPYGIGVARRILGPEWNEACEPSHDKPQEPERVTDHLADAKAALAMFPYGGPLIDAVSALIALAEDRESPTLTHRERALLKAVASVLRPGHNIPEGVYADEMVGSAERNLRGES